MKPVDATLWISIRLAPKCSTFIAIWLLIAQAEVYSIHAQLSALHLCMLITSFNPALYKKTYLIANHKPCQINSTL